MLTKIWLAIIIAIIPIWQKPASADHNFTGCDDDKDWCFTATFVHMVG